MLSHPKIHCKDQNRESTEGCQLDNQYLSIKQCSIYSAEQQTIFIIMTLYFVQ